MKFLLGLSIVFSLLFSQTSKTSFDKQEELFFNNLEKYSIQNNEIKKVILKLSSESFNTYQLVFNKDKVKLLKEKVEEEKEYYNEANLLCQMMYLQTEQMIKAKEKKDPVGFEKDKIENFKNIDSCNKDLKRKLEFLNVVMAELEKIEEKSKQAKYELVKIN
jgi:hypothetical protein